MVDLPEISNKDSDQTIENVVRRVHQGKFSDADQTVKDFFVWVMWSMAPFIATGWNNKHNKMANVNLSSELTVSDEAFLFWHLEVYSRDWRKTKRKRVRKSSQQGSVRQEGLGTSPDDAIDEATKAAERASARRLNISQEYFDRVTKSRNEKRGWDEAVKDVLWSKLQEQKATGSPGNSDSPVESEKEDEVTQTTTKVKKRAKFNKLNIPVDLGSCDWAKQLEVTEV